MHNLPDSFLPVLDFLKAQPAVERVLLFGSRARGDHFPRADIDIALDAPSLTWEMRRKIDDYLEDEAPMLHQIDCLWLQDTSLGNKLRGNILREGITL